MPPATPPGGTPPAGTPPPQGQPLNYTSPGQTVNVYTGPAPDSDSRTMAMLCHLLGILTGPIGPLVVWLLKKDTSPFVDDQGKEALNFQITVLIGWVIAGVTTFICIGPLIALAVFVVNLIFCIMGAMKANSGIAYRYPLNIRFIK